MSPITTSSPADSEASAPEGGRYPIFRTIIFSLLAIAVIGGGTAAVIIANQKPEEQRRPFTPLAVMADYAVLARNCGAKIIGGCCGTTPDHLRAMRAALEESTPGPAPTLDEIAEALGGFSSESDGTE